MGEKVIFHGTRGSLPSPLTAAQVRAKVLQALEAARGQTLPADEAGLAAFVDDLPASVRGTAGGNTPCVQLTTGGPDHVLLDAGTGLRDFAHAYRLRHTQGSRPSFPVGVTFHIFLSHLHWDHVQGLPFFYPLYAAGQRVVFYGGHDTLEAAVRAQFSAPSFPVPYERLPAQIAYERIIPGETRTVAGWHIRALAQNHPGGSFGYRCERNGKICVYSTDAEHKAAALAAPDYPFVEFFADADLLIFDAMYALADATFSKADWGHSSNVTGVELAARARVKRLALFHHDPHQNDAELEEVLFDTRMYAELYHQEKGRKLHGPRKYPEEVLLACDGREVEL
jgi:phosphoribosyl 1,2-cyclic phosphodiesterase